MTTIDRWLRDRAALTPGRVAIDHLGGEVTYAELDRRSDELAAGLDRGDRVATLTGNSPEHVALLYACAKAGAVLVPLSWRLSPHELAYQLDDADPAFFLVEDEFAELGEEALALAAVVPARGLGTGRVSNTVSLASGPEPVEAARELDTGRLSNTVSLASGPEPVDAARELGTGRVSNTVPLASGPEPGDPLLLIYTSGTTGRPKGALLTHANCFWTNLGFDLSTGVRGDDVVLQVLPQFHCGGWNVHPLLAWWKGARVVLERAFDPGRCLELIEGKRVTTMMGVPAVYQFLAEDPGFASADLSSLERVVVGGAPMPVALLDRWSERGVDIVQGYGLTEAAPNVLCLPPEDARRKAGYAGKPYPYVQVALSDEGELLVRGRNVFAGYWRNPEATEAAFLDGWLRTGDVAECDDEGFYRIKGRLKDMIISGGENIYPAEVEQVLDAHPAVVEAAVIGIPDERWGEVCAAFVVARHELEEAELVAYCHERLARFKVPKSFHFLAELPRNSIGKIQKSELKVTA